MRIRPASGQQMLRSITPAMCLCLFCLPSPCLTQEPPDQPHRSTFEEMGIHPTGQNGMEEIIAAGDLLRDIKALTEAQAPGSSLTSKRKVMSDSLVRRALALFRSGLKKPIHSVYAKVGVDTAFPHFSLCRNIARTLILEQYVLLADGKTSEAISSMEDVLQLGRAVQTEAVISGLVGHAILAMGTTIIARHIDQLPVRDCDRVIAVCRSLLQEPSRVPLLIGMERDFLASGVTVSRKNPKERLKEILDEDEDHLAAEINQVTGGRPAAEAELLNQAYAKIDENYLRLIRESGKPAWKRDAVEFEGGSLVERLARRMVFMGPVVLDRFDREDSLLKLLAIHAAIKSYKWEHDQLPDSIEQLKLGDLAVDPFTGDTIQYERKNEGYEVFCAGPVERDDDGRPIAGQRARVYLPNRPKPQSN